MDRLLQHRRVPARVGRDDHGHVASKDHYCSRTVWASSNCLAYSSIPSVSQAVISFGARHHKPRSLVSPSITSTNATHFSTRSVPTAAPIAAPTASTTRSASSLIDGPAAPGSPPRPGRSAHPPTGRSPPNHGGTPAHGTPDGWSR